jgi:hypothetical protein
VTLERRRARADTEAMDATPAAVTEADGFGLVDVSKITPPLAPRLRDVALESAAMVASLLALDDLAQQHCADLEPGAWTRHMPLGWRGDRSQSVRHLRAVAQLPAGAVWEAWLRDRGRETRDEDGHELLRATAALTARRTGVVELRGHGAVWWLVHALATLDAGSTAAGFLLDAAETTLCDVPRAEIDHVGTFSHNRVDWRTDERLMWLRLFGDVQARGKVTAAEARRAWGLWRWVSEPIGAPRYGADAMRHHRYRGSDRLPAPLRHSEVLLAHRDGAASDDDLLDHLVGPRGDVWMFSDVSHWTRDDVDAHPRARTLAAGAAARIVALELQRGDAPTLTTDAARLLSRSGGLDVLVAALAALGPKATFHTGYTGDTRKDVLSHILATTHPDERGTPERFATALAGTPRRRLIEVAMYVPRWAAHVEHATKLPGLMDAIWWLHAHARDEDHEYRIEPSPWRLALEARTPLSAQELFDGVVDVPWFQRVRDRLPAEAWPELIRAVKLCGSGGKRAGVFARALLGELTEEDLVAQVTAGKRDANALRALGLLAPDEPAALSRRWAVIEQFGRESRRFGSSRRAREQRAAEVAMENLARTAGYADPARLAWTMRAEQVRAALAAPALVLDDLEISLVVSGGAPSLAVRREPRLLKAVPGSVSKHPQVKALKDTVTDLRRQASGVRSALEAAMVRGDVWSPAELRTILGNPLVGPRLAALVLVSDGVSGLLDEDARHLVAVSGTRHDLAGFVSLTIAHPLDLWHAGALPAWRQAIVARRIEQPFKQVFREFYEPGAAERDGASRWQGYELDRGRAAALLSGRGWKLDHEEASTWTEHRLGLVAELETDPALGGAVEPGTTVVEGLSFRAAGDYASVDPADVPSRIFSEVQRDVDLAVSIAGARGSAMLVESRGALVATTVAALGVANVRVDGGVVHIDGRRAAYEVDLASGAARIAGAGALIVPVSSTDLARVFLPHAEEDPRTAELLATVLLLAEDDRIADPAIRAQLSG